MILELINHIFIETGLRWKIGESRQTPEESDIKKALDKAASILYDKDVGTSLVVGGLYIEKTPEKYDVYVYVGEYK